MRIVAFSDTHGRQTVIEDIIEAQKGAAAFFFLGDGLREAENTSFLYPNVVLNMVKGNCDFVGDDILGVVTIGGKKIMFTHGHRFGVKGGLDELIAEAKRRGADIVFYGHTHISKIDYIDGVYYLNPGSAGCGRNGNSYMAVDIVNGSVMPIIIPL